MIHRFATIALTLVALAGCALLPKVATPINQTEVYAALNAYGVAQSAALAYTALPPCPVGTGAGPALICKDQAVVVKIAHADALARAARAPLEAFVRNPANYPSLDYGALLRAFQATLAGLQQVEAQNGVH